MANHKSAKKQHKQSLIHAQRNRSTLSRLKTFVKKVLYAVEQKDSVSAQSYFRLAESEIMKAAKRGVLKLNNAARKVSKLCKKVKIISHS